MVILMSQAESTSVGWIWPVLLGAGLTFAAGMLGKAFEVKNSKRAWLMDQQLRLFTQVLAETHTVGARLWVLADLLAQSNNSERTPAQLAASEAVNVAVASQASRIAEAKLVAGKKTIARAEHLEEQTEAASRAFHVRQWLGNRPVEEVVEAFNENASLQALNEAVDEFTKAARVELSVHQ